MLQGPSGVQGSAVLQHHAQLNGETWLLANSPEKKLERRINKGDASISERTWPKADLPLG